MSLDPSLKSANALIRHRNVLTRDERILRLREAEKWQDGRSVFGLPKVGNRKAALAKAEKEETADGAAAPGTATATAAPAKGAPAKAAAAPAKGAAGAKPAAGAKAAAAAPAAKGKK